MNQALNPVECFECCVYALFISDRGCINNYCLLHSKPRHINHVVTLDRWLWHVTSFATKKIQIHCLTDMLVQQIIPPLTIISFENGCESYNTNI